MTSSCCFCFSLKSGCYLAIIISGVKKDKIANKLIIIQDSKNLCLRSLNLTQKLVSSVTLFYAGGFLAETKSSFVKFEPNEAGSTKL